MSGHSMPNSARVVIVGGGVIGTSVAYQLGRRGWKDVVVLEKNTLTSGTTWHAAGLITQARPTQGMRTIVQRSLEIFRSIEEETGFSPGYTQTGTIHIAMSDARHQELKQQQLAAMASGIETELLDADEVTKLHPLLNPEGLRGGLFYPNEGRGGASDTTMALARGAGQHGALILEGVEAIDVVRDGRRVAGVETSKGFIAAEVVVNATGMWGRQFGRMAGVNVPLQALAHYYVVTESIPGLQRNLPTIKSGDDCSYVKDEAGALLVGFFEPGSYAWESRQIPPDQGFIRLPEDWDHLGPFYDRMIDRVPILADAGIRLHFSGPESFTPDGIYHLGPAPLLANYFVAAGFNSVGFLSGPGAGGVLADWIVDGAPPVDLPEASPGRVQRHEANRRFLETRVKETLDISYSVHWPFEQRQSARPLRTSPLFEKTQAAGAVFGELRGWERPNWYARTPQEDHYEYSFGKPNWFEAVGEEHRHVREKVGLFDTSSFGKLMVQGPDSLRVLQRLSIRNIDVPLGKVVYTQWLTEQAGIQSDITITRLSEAAFLVMSGPATIEADHAYLLSQIGTDEVCIVNDITGSFAMLSIMGPGSRDFLQQLTDANLSNEAFPFATSQEIDLGFGFVRATRLTFVGELGWELLIPTDISRHIFDVLMDAGSSSVLRPAGYYAMNSLRLEKGYRSWGHDISSSENPIGAGLDFSIAWDKPGGFVGLAALQRIAETGVDRRLVQFLVEDPEVFLFHDEPIYRDGALVGRVESTQFGYSLGGAVVLAWIQAPEVVAPQWFLEGSYQVRTPSRLVAMRPSLRPLYDPDSTKIRS